MNMQQRKIEKLNFTKKVLDDRNIIYLESENGLIQIDNVDLWGTTSNWYDKTTGIKGVGLNALIKYLKEQKII